MSSMDTTTVCVRNMFLSFVFNLNYYSNTHLCLLILYIAWEGTQCKAKRRGEERRENSEEWIGCWGVTLMKRVEVFLPFGIFFGTVIAMANNNCCLVYLIICGCSSYLQKLCDLSSNLKNVTKLLEQSTVFYYVQ